MSHEIPQPEATIDALTRWWNIRWPRRPWWGWLSVCIGYVVLTVLWTWPLVTVFGTHAIQGVAPVPETPVDIAQNAWNIWHFRLHWADGSWPLATERVFFPLKINLTYQTYGLPNLLIAAPWAGIWGEISALNLLVFCGFIAGALGMYALLVGAKVADWLAFALGWLFVITPAHLAIVQTAGVERAMLGWLVVVHWSVARLIARPTVGRSAGVAAVLVVVSLSSGYYGLYGLVYGGVLLAAALTDTQVRTRWRQSLGGYVAAGAAWAATMLALMTWPAGGYAGQRTVDLAAVFGSADLALDDWYLRQTHPWHVVSLLDLVRFPVAHPFWRLWGDVVYTHPSVGGYLGVGVLIVLGLTVWRLRRIWPMFAVGVVALWFAAGPELRFWPEQTVGVLPAPYAVLNLLSVYRNATRPGMFVLFAWIPLVLVLAAGLTQIAQRHRGLAVAVVALLWLDFVPQPWGVVPMEPTPVAAAIDKQAPAGSVLEIPAQIDEGQGLIDQMCHGRPIAAGYLARIPDFYATRLVGLATPPPLYADVIPTDPIRELGNLGVRFLVVHPDAPGYVTATLEGVTPQLLGRYGRDRLYAVPEPTEASLVAATDWWESEAAGDTRWRWSQAQSRLVVTSDRARVVRIAMTYSSMRGRTAHWLLNGVPVATMAVPAQPAMTSRVLSLRIRAGVNDLVLHSDTDIDPFGRAVGVAFTRLEVVGSTVEAAGERLAIPATETDTVFCR